LVVVVLVVVLVVVVKAQGMEGGCNAIVCPPRQREHLEGL
jgi:hypothetical protein